MRRQPSIITRRQTTADDLAELGTTGALLAIGVGCFALAVKLTVYITAAILGVWAVKEYVF